MWVFQIKLSNNLVSIVALLLKCRKSQNMFNRWINAALNMSLKFSNKSIKMIEQMTDIKYSRI